MEWRSGRWEVGVEGEDGADGFCLVSPGVPTDSRSPALS